MRYLVVCSYFGHPYYGWQKQSDVKTIQGEIEAVLSRYFNDKITIHGSGRTDAKVHAIGQTFHFDAPKVNQKSLLYALNKMLSSDIKLLKIKTVSDQFHARYDVKEKVYRYGIVLSDKEPFLTQTRLVYPYPFDLAKFKQALDLFSGRHDFRSFTSKPSDEEKFVRDIFFIKVKQVGKEVIVDFSGSGFMQGQIRMIVGTALAYAGDKIQLDYMTTRLDCTQRQVTSYKVGGEGLYLIRVKY